MFFYISFLAIDAIMKGHSLRLIDRSWTLRLSALSRISRLLPQEQELLGKWRKLKGIAQVQLPNGIVRLAEVHWYEAHGIGKKEFKLKLPFLD